MQNMCNLLPTFSFNGFTIVACHRSLAALLHRCFLVCIILFDTCMPTCFIVLYETCFYTCTYIKFEFTCLACDALVGVLWLLCIVYVIWAQPASVAQLVTALPSKWMVVGSSLTQAAFSLKNNCLGRVLLCCFVFGALCVLLLCLCCVVLCYIAISWMTKVTK